MPSFLFFLNSYVVRILVVLVALSAYTVRANSQENGKVNVYTTREPKLVQPLLEAFTRQHGIAVNLAFFKDGMVERVKAEGTNSPADILMTVDIATMIDLVNQNLTQAIESEVLKKSIPENLRDKEGHWYVMSLRDRVVYASKDLKLKEIHYEDLAKPEWRDKVCIRSGPCGAGGLISVAREIWVQVAAGDVGVVGDLVKLAALIGQVHAAH
jgi:iron(III) transport system substrate-binding protein